MPPVKLGKSKILQHLAIVHLIRSSFELLFPLNIFLFFQSFLKSLATALLPSHFASQSGFGNDTVYIALLSGRAGVFFVR
jgi:hypothetical protein